jgi:Fe-S-cluster-containing dehydrogenase component/DMSO reductase anchor subunit
MTDVLARPSALDVRPAPSIGSPDECSVLVFDDESPIDRYLREQQTMTAVDRFSRHHDEVEPGALLPDQARYYRDLVPMARPGEGQQYGFEVDLDACSGCKACVTACHSLNGLDEAESFRSAGALLGTRTIEVAVEPALAVSTLTVEPWQQTITTACHHCVDPACLNGCPVDAYEKDPVTGIVRHLDDQCIGCSYCTLTCPYEVPQFNAERGIVRKCDLCSDRLAEGEAPACVQACPTSAISVGIVDVAEAIARAAAGEGSSGGVEAALVPAAPPSHLTIPTTRYRSSKPLPADALPADHFSLVPSHAHPPLTVMLVLTQLAVGAFVLAWLVDLVAAPSLADRLRPFEAGVALGVGVLALAASLLHLGRPLYAWRAVIGLRHSWLSREIVAFGGFAGLAAAYAVAVFADAPPDAVRAVGAVTSLTGLVGVGCSVMIYAVTRRHWWRVSHSGPKFALTTVIAGSSAVAATALLATAGDAEAFGRVLVDVVAPLATALVLATLAKLAGEATMFTHLRDREYTDLRRTAMLLRDELATVTAWRYATGIAGGLIAPLVLIGFAGGAPPTNPWPSVVVAVVGLVAVVAGELCERWQFFTAITSPRMPGVPT